MRARRVVGLILAALLATMTLEACTPAPRPLKVEVWGDSIAQQSGDYINFFLGINHKATTRVHVFPGTAICDWLTDMRNETDWRRSSYHPDVAVLIFSGIAFTPCMVPGGKPYTGQALVNKYQADADRAISIFSAAHVPVYFVSTPITRDQENQFHYVGMNPMGEMLSKLPARFPGPIVRFIDAGSAVEWQGQYTDWLPCLFFEKCMARWPYSAPWPKGTLVVRVRQADGYHFCPTNVVVRNNVQVCPVQSPGAMRFAMAITGTILRQYGLN